MARGRRYLQLHDDVATVAHWYQTLPPLACCAVRHLDAREII
ncbi:MAG: hypothetical protein ACRDZ2_12250 [Ilumatobacteraceae bacterium]